jgi:hypothetical protein
MLRKLVLTISYLVAVVYIFLIVSPSIYCFQHGCRGPEGDAFMPAFFLAPVGTIATAFCLRNTIQNIRKRQTWSWLFWFPAIIFAIVVLVTIVFIVLLIHQLTFHHH